MTIKELKEFIKDLPDDMPVLVWFNEYNMHVPPILEITECVEQWSSEENKEVILPQALIIDY